MKFLLYVYLDIHIKYKMPPKRKTIPKVLKDLVWDKNIGKDKGVGECYVCKQQIESKKFHCGHIISEKDGGETQLNNLKPICATCNLSMGTQNMEEFKKLYFQNNINVNVIKKCYFELLHDIIDSEFRSFITYKPIIRGSFGGCKNYKEIDLLNLVKELNLNKDNTLRLIKIIPLILGAMNKEHICTKCLDYYKILSTT